MAKFYFIRHGSHDLLGRALVGRAPGVCLNGQGQRQAHWVADRLGGIGLDALYSSPMERTKETAAAIASRTGLEVQLVPEFTEIDFGDWTNQSFSDLLQDPAWARFNARRSRVGPPNGETMLQAQNRAVAKLESIQQNQPEAKVAIVSHADTIKGILAYYLGVPLDLFDRIEVGPGSISILALEGTASRIELLNDRMPD